MAADLLGKPDQFARGRRCTRMDDRRDRIGQRSPLRNADAVGMESASGVGRASQAARFSAKSSGNWCPMTEPIPDAPDQRAGEKGHWPS